MQLLAFMEAACQIGQANVGIGRHTLVGICWGHSSFNTLDQECPLFLLSSILGPGDSLLICQCPRMRVRIK